MFVLRLWVSLVNDALSEYSYDADLAGLSYGFSENTTGVSISVFGYNEKLSHLLKRILDHIKSAVVNPERLSVMKEKVRSLYFSLKVYMPNFFLSPS